MLYPHSCSNCGRTLTVEMGIILAFRIKHFGSGVPILEKDATETDVAKLHQDLGLDLCCCTDIMTQESKIDEIYGNVDPIHIINNALIPQLS